MNENFKTFTTFLLGAAAGSVVAWYLTKKKYIREFQEWAEEFKLDLRDELSSRFEDCQDEEEYYEDEDELRDSIEEEDARWDRVAKVASERAYGTPTRIQDYAANLPQPDVSEEEGEFEYVDAYVITPEEFSNLEDEGYSTETLTYYADGVLTDYLDNIIDNVDDVIGEGSLEHFGEYEEDTVFVRNDHLMVGYEIQRDLRTYAEVVGE